MIFSYSSLKIVRLVLTIVGEIVLKYFQKRSGEPWNK
jgi:hypothetical protein